MKALITFFYIFLILSGIFILSCEKEEIQEVQNITNKLKFTEIKVDTVTYREATLTYKLENLYKNKVQSLGICYNTSGGPTRNDDTVSLKIDSSGTKTIDGLSPDRKYHFRFYAENRFTTIYSDDENFFTNPLRKPSVITAEVTDIDTTSATTGGNIKDNGGLPLTARGVCWSTSQNPTVNDNHTSDGTGTGSFTSEMTGLTKGIKYYVRAYANNSVGTAYGDQVSFTTLETHNGTMIVDVTNPATGKTWMDRNLGASRAATSSTDEAAYGDLYQWGRAADGHEKRNSATTSTLSNSDTPGHGDFITVGSSPYDWRSPQNDNLWQGVNGTNNPCPSGYRLPTEAEWEAERQSWSSNDVAGAYASPLKLPVAGCRGYSNGSLYDVGSYGYYWSSTVDGPDSRRLYFYSGAAYMYSSHRASGLSVRCLKD